MDTARKEEMGPPLLIVVALLLAEISQLSSVHTGEPSFSKARL